MSLSCKKADERDAPKSAGSDYAATTEALSATAEGLLPESLKYDSSGALQEGNPCTGTNGLMDCQPNLLKRYASMAQDLGTSIATFLEAITEGVEKNIAIGASGEISGEGEISTIAYDYPEAGKFKILLSSDTGPAIYLDVDGPDYVAEFYPGAFGSDASAGSIRALVSYTDDDTFTADYQLVGFPCSDDDVYAPSTIRLFIDRDGDTWAGKAMMYHPRWRAGATCDDEPTTASKAFLYTDFVGTDENTTAEVYAMPSGVDSTDEFTDYDLSDICSTFSNVCTGGIFGSEIPSNYENPFCVSAETGEATWNSAFEDLPVSGFSASANWTLPDDLADLEIEPVQDL